MTAQSFFHEMVVHPALFSHARPQAIAILGDADAVLAEVLKHVTVKQVAWVGTSQQKIEDPRVTLHPMEPIQWSKQCATAQFDVIIQLNTAEDKLLHYQRPLSATGILVAPLPTTLLHLDSLTPIYQTTRQAGFERCQLLHFPQPSHPYGWHTLMLLTKQPELTRIREKDIYNRPFTTHYYNYDTHRAALALPEFLRETYEIF